MALSDPISITVNGVAKSLARVSVGNRQATYATADGLFTLLISHQNSGKGNSRIRTLVSFTQKKIVTNPLDSSNDYDTVTINKVYDRPAFGFSNTEVDQLDAGLDSWLDTTINGKLMGGES
jgi:hypothetical protein